MSPKIPKAAAESVISQGPVAPRAPLASAPMIDPAPRISRVERRWQPAFAGLQPGDRVFFSEPGGREDRAAEESALVDIRLTLGRLVRATRQKSRLSQQALADRLHSSQSRVAKLEAGDASVSLDLIVKAAFAAGAKKRELAKAIAPRKRLAFG